ncbi:hypothetical protein SKAU_G00100900 [Synaphobranchus kaupii]|uniref:Uncharacterized protein n=1 Tax=Synaphobranchus kaupii TaxID=118154 RepID=A0A9Q1FYS3_SYNKA|nr:hypothetical protein SKAU_G00100900 [Synaphobranchus kaupii]
MNDDADHAPPPSLSISADQVRSELRRLHPNKAAGKQRHLNEGHDKRAQIPPAAVRGEPGPAEKGCQDGQRKGRKRGGRRSGAVTPQGLPRHRGESGPRECGQARRGKRVGNASAASTSPCIPKISPEDDAPALTGSRETQLQMPPF